MRLGLLAIAALALGCRRPPEPTGRWTRCTCDYLTDFDQPGKVLVDACILREVPEAVAESCAGLTGVGHVSECRCELPGDACRPSDGVCRDVK